MQNTGEGGVRWSLLTGFLKPPGGGGQAGDVLCSESMPGGTQGLTQDHRGQTRAGSPDLTTPPHTPSWHWGFGGEGRPLAPGAMFQWMPGTDLNPCGSAGLRVTRCAGSLLPPLPPRPLPTALHPPHTQPLVRRPRFSVTLTRKVISGQGSRGVGGRGLG